jgi:hypothetical protein
MIDHSRKRSIIAQQSDGTGMVYFTAMMNPHLNIIIGG